MSEHAPEATLKLKRGLASAHCRCRTARRSPQVMTQFSAVSLLLGLACLSGGCQSDEGEARPGGAGAAGASGGTPGAAGSAVGTGGSNAAGSGGASAGSSTQAGSAAIAGGGQATGGTTAQGGQAGSAQSGGGAGGSGGAGGLPPIEECTGTPSVDRFTQWVASGEGLTEPATGTIVTMQGGEYVAKVHFVGSEWHVIPVYVANKFGDTADLSTSKGITLTYSATAELHLQLRSETKWSGGDQYATTIASTNGQKETRFFSFEAAGWQSLFGTPELSWADTLKEGMGLVFVGNSENDVVFYGMRIDGWTPPCP